MKKLTKDLKRMLDALAAQHAGDYLSRQEKIEILGGYKSTFHNRNQRSSQALTLKPVRRLALLYDGSEQTALLDFVVDTCHRQGQPVKVDILQHGEPKKANLESLRQHLDEANINFEIQLLSSHGFETVLDYLQQTSALISMVACSDDVLARRLTEQVLPETGERLYVPIVLISGSGPAASHKRTAA